MNDLLVLLILAALGGLALYSCLRKKRQGCGGCDEGCGGCGGCGGGCGSCKGDCRDNHHDEPQD